jgi:hypothetical protein
VAVTNDESHTIAAAYILTFIAFPVTKAIRSCWNVISLSSENGWEARGRTNAKGTRQSNNCEPRILLALFRCILGRKKRKVEA